MTTGPTVRLVVIVDANCAIKTNQTQATTIRVQSVAEMSRFEPR